MKFFMIISTIIAMLLNFNGIYNDASIINLIVTIIYLGFWGVMHIYSVRCKDNSDMIFTIVFWSIVLFTAFVLLLGSINIIGIEGLEIMYILIFLFIFPMYGITFLIDSYIIFCIIMIVISSLFIISGVIYLIKSKKMINLIDKYF